MVQIIIAVIVAVVGSNGLWALLQSRLARKDTMADKKDDIKEALKKLCEKIDMINDKVDRNAATLARTHILRFDDEVTNYGIHYHSKEYWLQTLQDMDTYEKFCETHAGFRNNCAVLAIDYIKRMYKILQDDLTEEGAENE